jgi:hypothetical protein
VIILNAGGDELGDDFGEGQGAGEVASAAV